MGRQSAGMTCCVCKQVIPASHHPWIEVTLTGANVAWHTTCDEAKRAKETNRDRTMRRRVPVLPEVDAVSRDPGRDDRGARKPDKTARSTKRKPRQATPRQTLPVICAKCGESDPAKMTPQRRECRSCTRERVKARNAQLAAEIGYEAVRALATERTRRYRERLRA